MICVDVSSNDGSEETTMMMKINKRKKNISSSYQICVCVFNRIGMRSGPRT